MKLKAIVYRDLRSLRWMINVDNPVNTSTVVMSAWSWPEAMQLAYKLLADLDRQLMHEVYASRANRRMEKRS